MPRADGIDVSKWQGTIDWNAVRAGGYQWCATRIWDRQEGPGVDKTFIRNRAGMSFARHRLLYWYLEPNRSIAEQAAQCVAIVGPLAAGEGIMLDAEDTTTESQAFTWCQLVEAHTRRPVCVYTALFVDGARTWRSTRIFDGTRPRVFAAYKDEATARSLAAPFSWDAWQWTSTGHVAGITGNVDLNQVDHPAAFDPVCGLTNIPPPQLEEPPMAFITRNAAGSTLVVAADLSCKDFIQGADYAALQAAGYKTVTLDEGTINRIPFTDDLQNKQDAMLSKLDALIVAVSRISPNLTPEQIEQIAEAIRPAVAETVDASVRTQLDKTKLAPGP